MEYVCRFDRIVERVWRVVPVDWGHDTEPTRRQESDKTRTSQSHNEAIYKSYHPGMPYVSHVFDSHRILQLKATAT